MASCCRLTPLGANHGIHTKGGAGGWLENDKPRAHVLSTAGLILNFLDSQQQIGLFWLEKRQN